MPSRSGRGGLGRGNGLGGAGPSGPEGTGALSGRGLRIGGGSAGYGGSGRGGGGETGVGNRWASAGLVGVDGAYGGATEKAGAANSLRTARTRAEDIRVNCSSGKGGAGRRRCLDGRAKAGAALWRRGRRVGLRRSRGLVGRCGRRGRGAGSGAEGGAAEARGDSGAEVREGESEALVMACQETGDDRPVGGGDVVGRRGRRLARHRRAGRTRLW